MRLQSKFDIKLVCFTAALICLSLSLGALRAADQPQQRHSALVMMGTYDTYHMKPEQVEAVADLLAGYCKLAANFSDNPADFTFENARKYDVIILFSALSRDAQGERPTKTALENVFRAVEAGTPLLTIHGGVNITTRDGGPNIEEKIGCRYAKGSHYPYQRLTVKIDKTHPITQGMEDFVVLDEPYRLDVIASDADILASYDPRVVNMSSLLVPNLPEARKAAVVLSHQWAEKTAQAPVLYTRMLGKGKIVMNFLGHDEQTLRNPSFRTLTEQSLQWLLGER
jgi:type 1 glutamine amidotransferase